MLRFCDERHMLLKLPSRSRRSRAQPRGEWWISFVLRAHDRPENDSVGPVDRPTVQTSRTFVAHYEYQLHRMTRVV